jgi:glycosyltransferase involved in cell wall biosynthesis
MGKNIAILTSGHPPTDERIFWKFAVSLSSAGNNAEIICSTGSMNTIKNNIPIKGVDGKNKNKKEKVLDFTEMLNSKKRDIIICCEPLTIVAANLYKKKYNRSCKIISDVTEWYPENVAFKHTGFKKYIAYTYLFLFNIYTSNLADVLIIGEETKKRRYSFIAPFKKKVIIGYYPVLKYFRYSQPGYNGKKLTLCYAGLLKTDRGILKLIEAARKLACSHPDLNIRLKLIGKFENSIEEEYFRKLTRGEDKFEIIIEGWVKYPEISSKVADADICFDLRAKNFIYNHSLPIKIFEYMACGKPYIFSKVNPIVKELGEDKYGLLVDPEDIGDIIEKIERYISSPSLLIEHSKSAREETEKDKSWEKESEKLLTLIESIG